MLHSREFCGYLSWLLDHIYAESDAKRQSTTLVDCRSGGGQEVRAPARRERYPKVLFFFAATHRQPSTHRVGVERDAAPCLVDSVDQHRMGPLFPAKPTASRAAPPTSPASRRRMAPDGGECSLAHCPSILELSWTYVGYRTSIPPISHAARPLGLGPG